jgi:hypothetical protein
MRAAISCVLLALAPATAFAQRASVLRESIPAYDAVVRDDVLFVLEPPDGHVLAAYALPSRTPRWRTPLPGATTNQAQLALLEPDRLLAWNGGQLYVVARATGRIEARASYSPTSRPRLSQRDGACALSVECEFQPIDCADARLLGSPARGSEIVEESPVCDLSFDPAPLGATPSSAVYVYSRGQSPATVVGLDRATGTERYASSTIGCSHCARNAGGSLPEDDLCWTVNDSAAVEVRAFACSTGASRWSWRTSASTISHVVTAGWIGHGAVLVSTDTLAALLDARTGAPRWTHSLSAHTLATIDGARSDALALENDSYDSLVTLDGSSGGVRGTLAIAHGRHLVLQPNGSYVVSDGEALALDDVAIRQAAPHDHASRHRGGGDASPMRVRVRATGATVLTLSPSGWSLAETTDGRNVLGVLFESSRNGNGRVRFVRVSP